MKALPRRTLLAAALGAALAAGAPLAQAADTPITIMVGGINKIIYLPAKLRHRPFGVFTAFFAFKTEWFCCHAHA